MFRTLATIIALVAVAALRRDSIRRRNERKPDEPGHCDRCGSELTPNGICTNEKCVDIR